MSDPWKHDPRSEPVRKQAMRDRIRQALRERRDIRASREIRTPGEYEQRRRNPHPPHVSSLRPRSLFSDRPSSAGRRRGVSLAREMFDEHSGRSGIHPRQAARLWRAGRHTSEGDHIVDNNRDGIYFNGRFVPYANSLKRKISNSRHKKARNSRNMARSRYASKAKRSSRRGYKSKGMKKSYSRRPKGAYRGATIPKWMKGETKHILVHDGNQQSAAFTTPYTTAAGTDVTSNVAGGTHTTSHKLDIGDIVSYSLNPMIQGNDKDQRNGRSVDGTYLRLQGHIHNKATKSPSNTLVSGSTTEVSDSDIQQRCYVRMLILACKGGNVPTGTGATAVGTAPFDPNHLYKKIDGTVLAFNKDYGDTQAAARVRSLQLPVNKALYTVLSDQTFQLSAATEGFGSSDILFDKKIKLKQRTTWHDAAKADSFQKNQLVAVFMTVDPHMYGSTSLSSRPSQLADKIELEFESKYSYKDF